MRRERMMADPMMAGRVLRYHTWPTLTEETVAHHSWGVLMIYVRLFGVPRAEVLVYIAEHDLPELHTGDLPFPVKKNYPVLGDAVREVEQDASFCLNLYTCTLTHVEQKRVKVCDLLQMREFGLHEMRLGNHYAKPIVEDTQNAALSLLGEAAAKLARTNSVDLELVRSDIGKVGRWIMENQL